MMKKTFALMMAAACCAAQAVTVKPENTDEILVNPDMGLVMFHYSNRQWAYGQLQERGDTLDWFPGVSTIYFRLPWCLLEPQEGQYRWDLFDSYAAPWIAAGKQIAFRVTCCESRYTYATPEWVKDAGAKGWFFKMKMAKIYGKEPPGSETDIWEPDYGDPVFLKKLENFLKAMARRYDGKPYVAFMDIGTIGMWGEGHTRAYGREMKAQGRDPEAAFHVHYDLHRRIFPHTTLLCIDDQAGSSDPRPAAEVPLMKHAHDLGFGFRDDSILVFTPEMIPARLKPHPWWFHANWADYFAPAAPVFVEHEHYNLSRDRGAWSDEKLVESVEAYHATWLSLHGWPKEIYDNSKDAYARAARRLGYRFELREVDYPETVKLGQPVTIKSTWVNVGAARRYKGATLAWSLVDDKGRVAWVSTDDAYDFADALPKTGNSEHPVTRATTCTFGWTGEIPQINDGVWVYTVHNKIGNYATDTRVPTLTPGTYTLCASLGEPDGTPRLALPLKGGKGLRYPIGRLAVTAAGADFDIRAFGAVGDGRTKDTAAVQRALDACAQAGGGRVTVPPGTYLIGSVYLGDRTELHLQEGATLLGSPDLADYNAPDAYPQNFGSKNEGWSAKHLILALEKQGVSITGRGVIDGNGRAFFDDKPQFVGKICWRDGGINAKDRKHQGRPGQEIVFIECRDVAVRDVTFRDMSCWSCFFHGCENVTVGGVTVRNGMLNLNTDGFDVDSCRNVTIGDCDIVTGDDAIAIRGAPARLKDPAKVCENVRVSNIVCRVSADGMRVGVGNGTIRNLHVSDMKIEHAGRGLHLQCVYGKPGPKGVDISDISFERVSIRDAAEAIHVGVGSDISAATLANIRFSHVSAEALAPSVVCGGRVTRVKGVTFADCSFNVARPASKAAPHDAEDKALRSDGLGAFRVQSADDVSFANCTFQLNGAPVTDPRHIFSTQDAALPTLK